MKTKAALLFAFAVLCLGSLAYAADASAAPAPAAAAPASLPALADLAASLNPAGPASCPGSSAASFSLPAVPDFGPGGPTALVLLCGSCGDPVCTGGAINATCAAGRKCFVITNCGTTPKTWQCTCSTEAP
jgi:hypothetical protein